MDEERQRLRMVHDRLPVEHHPDGGASVPLFNSFIGSAEYNSLSPMEPRDTYAMASPIYRFLYDAFPSAKGRLMVRGGGVRDAGFEAMGLTGDRFEPNRSSRLALLPFFWRDMARFPPAVRETFFSFSPGPNHADLKLPYLGPSQGETIESYYSAISNVLLPFLSTEIVSSLYQRQLAEIDKRTKALATAAKKDWRKTASSVREQAEAHSAVGRHVFFLEDLPPGWEFAARIHASYEIPPVLPIPLSRPFADNPCLIVAGRRRTVNEMQVYQIIFGFDLSKDEKGLFFAGNEPFSPDWFFRHFSVDVTSSVPPHLEGELDRRGGPAATTYDGVRALLSFRSPFRRSPSIAFPDNFPVILTEFSPETLAVFRESVDLGPAWEKLDDPLDALEIATRALLQGAAREARDPTKRGIKDEALSRIAGRKEEFAGKLRGTFGQEAGFKIENIRRNLLALMAISPSLFCEYTDRSGILDLLLPEGRQEAGDVDFSGKPPRQTNWQTIDETLGLSRVFPEAVNFIERVWFLASVLR